MSISIPHIFRANGSRSVLIRKNILAGFVIKGWSALTILLTVPLTLHCLGAYQNGIWLTISSILVWIDMLDVGLGNGLRNQLTIDLAHQDLKGARHTVSSTLAMLSAIVGITLVLFWALIPAADTYHLLNADPSQVVGLTRLLIVAVTLVCITFVMRLIGNVYMAMQLPAVGNLLTALGQTLALIGTWMLYVSHQGSLLHIVLVNTASPLLVYLLAYPYTFFHRYPQLRPSFSCIDMHKAKGMMTLGLRFFALQLASLVLFLSSNLIISHLYSPDAVNPYQIAYRYFSLILILFTIVCTPYWNATTDAYTRQDYDWIRRSGQQMRLVICLMAGALVVMVLLSGWVYGLWIGHQVEVPFSLSLGMACYIGVLISSMRYSYFLNGIGALRLQLITAITAAVAFLPLAWLTARCTDSLTGFVAVLCLVNVPGLIINRIQFNRIITGKATGVWRR